MPKDLAPHRTRCLIRVTKSSLLNAVEIMCGSNTKHQWRKESWWWNVAVDSAVNGGGNAEKPGRKVARGNIRRPSDPAPHPHPQEASQAKQEILKEISGGSSDLFFLADQLMWEYVDVQGTKTVPNVTGDLWLDVRATQTAWIEHYEHLLDVEFEWDPDSFTEAFPVDGLRVGYRMSMGQSIYRLPGHHHWIAGGTAREADALED